MESRVPTVCPKRELQATMEHYLNTTGSAAIQLGFRCQINFFASDIKYENCVAFGWIPTLLVSTSHFMLILLLAAVSLLAPRGQIHEMSLPCLPDHAPARTNATNGAHQSQDNIDASGNTLNLPRASSIPCFASPSASTSRLSCLGDGCLCSWLNRN